MPEDASEDTIVALASPPGRGGRAVLRLSGVGTGRLLRRFVGTAANNSATETPTGPPDWTAVRCVRQVSLPWPGLTGDAVPRVPITVLNFPGSGGYTGEPAAELHMLASPPLVTAMLGYVVDLGARPARPGEFTLRAFLAGRLDLAQAEAVRDVIDSDTPGDLMAALDRLAGGLGRTVRRIRSDLLDLLADLEAGLDFVDEDLTFVTTEQTVTRIVAAREAVERARTELAARGLGAAAPTVVLVGRPNAGKSRLFNRMVGREAALVSEVAGTTRDIVTAPVSETVGGRTVRYDLIDTAGLTPGQAENAWPKRRSSEDRDDADALDESEVDVAQGRASIDRASEQRTTETLTQAAVVLLLVQAGRPWGDDERALWERLPSESRLLVRSQADRIEASPSRFADGPSPEEAMLVSSVTGQGVDALRAAVVERLVARTATAADRVSPAAQTALAAASEILARSQGLAQTQAGDELVALELRLALDALGRVVGETVTEDILDRLFARFCIGK